MFQKILARAAAVSDDADSRCSSLNALNSSAQASGITFDANTWPLPARRGVRPGPAIRLLAGASARAYGGFCPKESAMRLLPILLFALPAIASAQLYPMLPQQGVQPIYAAPVQGGGAVIVSPGQSPTYVTPDAGWGGSAIVSPGAPPTYIVPGNAGGSAIVTPGYGTTLVRPNPMGGTTVVPSNQMPTYIVPNQRGGSTIVGPGGIGYAVPTPHGAYIQPPGNVPPTVIYRP
jgi:hypothetical protein